MDEAARQPFKDVETKETERFDAEMLAYNEPVRAPPSPPSSGPLDGVVETALGRKDQVLNPAAVCVRAGCQGGA